MNLRQSSIQVIGQSGQMMQATLNDHNVSAGVGKRQLVAIAHATLRISFIRRQQARR